MRLVIQYQVSDECTYSYEVNTPVEYESAEAFAVDFEKFVMDNWTKYSFEGFDFAGKKWEPSNHGKVHASLSNTKFEYYAPTILTVDEWFAQ